MLLVARDTEFLESTQATATHAELECSQFRPCCAKVPERMLLETGVFRILEVSTQQLVKQF